MTQRLTRRQWAGALAVAVPASAASAVAAASPAAAQTAAASDSPEELLTQARRALQRDRAALGNFKIKMALEPATRFEA